MGLRRKSKYKAPKTKKIRIKSKGRVQGDAYYFFAWHTLISMLTTVYIIITWNLLPQEDLSLSYLFTSECWLLVFQMFGIFILVGFMARLLAYAILKIFFTYGLKKEIKKINELNVGINKMTSVSYFLAAFFSAITFTLGVMFLLQDNLFDTDSYVTLFGAYIVLKVVIYVVAWFIVESKL